VSPPEQIKFDELKEYLKTFLAGFYDKFKELLTNEGRSSPLKSSILSESRALSTSQVSLGQQLNQLSSSQVSSGSV
jgi:hypothetical protein